MTKHPKFIALLDADNGETTIHARLEGNYATLCGCSDDDDMMSEVAVPRSGKIDCPQCEQIFTVARSLRATDFT